MSLQAFSEIDSQFFWRKKEIQREMLENRKIVVSVTREKTDWHFKGAGIVKRSKAECFQEALNFDRLKEIQDRFSLVEFDSSQSVLRLQILFLGKKKDLQVQINPSVAKDRIGFEVIEGWQKGLRGDMFFSDAQSQQAEVGIISRVQKESSWIPDFVFETAVEAVMHHIAHSLRNGLEKGSGKKL